MSCVHKHVSKAVNVEISTVLSDCLKFKFQSVIIADLRQCKSKSKSFYVALRFKGKKELLKKTDEVCFHRLYVVSYQWQC